MEKFSLLFTTDYGLMSLGVIVFIIVMGFYLSGKLKKLMNQDLKHPIEKVGVKLRARMPWLNG